MKTYNNRSEVPEKYKWDLTDFYKNEEEFEEDYQKCIKLIKKIPEYVECLKNPEKLYDFLKLYETIDNIWENLYVYSLLVNDQELGKKQSIERLNKISLLENNISQSLGFFEPKLLKLNKKEYELLFKENNNLLEYKKLLDYIYKKKEHVLSESKQIIVSELIKSLNNFSEISSNLINNEHDYGKVKLNDGTLETIATNNVNKLLKNNNREIRKKVYKSFYKKIDEYSGTSASLLNNYVMLNDSLSKIYKFRNPWEEKLFELNIPNKVFENLVSVVECQKSTKQLQKYYELKKEILGYDELYFYDRLVNLNKNNKKYSIEESQSLVRKSLLLLGEDYLKKYDKIIRNRYIDYCQYKGKCSGGYSISTPTKDSRILMSFNGELDSVSTMAHESGHNIHHQFLKENVPIQYRNQAIMVCEVASLTNECLLSYYIVNNSKNREEKLEGLENIINIIISNLYGAVREGKIEQDIYDYIHEGGILTKEYMQDLVTKSLRKYYGSCIKLTKFDKNSWVLRSHYFNDFYLYNYAISICIAINIAHKIIKKENNMLEKYIKFLKTGNDVLPLETLKILDIDLESEDIYKNTIKYFANLVEQFEKIYKGSE